MKMFFYVIAFAFFGLIVATIIHAVVELVALELIFGNPARFADTFWWTKWHLLHHTLATLLWFVGFCMGVYYGFKYWKPYGSKPGFYHWGNPVKKHQKGCVRCG